MKFNHFMPISAEKDPMVSCAEFNKELVDCTQSHAAYFSTLAPISSEEVLPIIEESSKAADFPKQTDHDLDYITWEKENKDCGFCKTFIESPCNFVFKDWHVCVDKAKAEGKDYVTECTKYTDRLLSCTEAHSDYFKQVNEAVAINNVDEKNDDIEIIEDCNDDKKKS